MIRRALPTTLAAAITCSTLGVTAVVASSGCSSKGSGAAEKSDSADAAKGAEGGSDDASALEEPGGDDASASPDVASPPSAGVKFAMWSAQALPAVDFCVAPHGTQAFLGPMLLDALASLSTTDAGGAPDDAGDAGPLPGLVYPQVSTYSSVPPGQYDVRVVAAGSPNCDVGVLPDATDLPVLGTGGIETVALMDEPGTDGGPAIGIVGFPDDADATIMGSVDDGSVAQGRILLRFITADVAEPLVDFGTGLDQTPPFFNTVFLAVPPDQHATLAETVVTPATTDANGYLGAAATLQTLDVATSGAVTGTMGSLFSVRRTRTATVLAQAVLVASPGQVVTLVLLPAASLAGVPGSFGASPPGEALLICYDNAATGGTLAACSFMP